eukprot:4790364-Karenia_brevis.AAC.1
MRTDCRSLLDTASGGVARATMANKQLARVWSQIGAAVDGDLASLVASGALVWMPAHQSISAIGVRTLSNGKELSAVDWRANRLVDSLAKKAAGANRAPSAALNLLDSATHAVKHAATLLGLVTHAANNHKEQVVAPDGKITTIIRRDAQQPAQRKATGARRRARAPQVSVPMLQLDQLPVEKLRQLKRK